MNLNDPQVSHAITLVMEQLNKQDKYRLTDLLMEFEELTQSTNRKNTSRPKTTQKG
jgi:hypothetical protein